MFAASYDRSMDCSSVSVVIPTFSHRDFVLDAVQSALAQEYPNLEVIVVDDGSVDGTAQVLAPLGRGQKIRYVWQENQGMAAARNRGLELAQGGYVAFLDDDDLWPQNKLAWQVEFLDENPQCAAVVGDFEFIGNGCKDRKFWRLAPGNISFTSLFSGNPVLSPGQALLRTSVVRQLKGFDQQIWGADDFDFWFRLAQHHQLVAVNKPGLKYRLHSRNASRNTSRMVENVSKVLSEHLNSIASSDLPEAADRARYFIAEYAAYCAKLTGVHDIRTLVKLVCYWIQYASWRNYRHLLAQSARSLLK